MSDDKKLLRVKDICEIFGISRSCVFRWVKSKKLPSPTKLGARLVVWHKSTIEQILAKIENGSGIGIEAQTK